MRKLLLAFLMLAATPAAPQGITNLGQVDNTRALICGLVLGTGTTTGTTKEEIGACVIPANALPGVYVGFEIEALFAGAANGNAKTVGVEFPALGGTSLGERGSSVTSQRFGITVRCLVSAAGELVCTNACSLIGGTADANKATVNVIGLDFAQPQTISMFATTATQAGDIILRSYAIYGIRNPN